MPKDGTWTRIHLIELKGLSVRNDAVVLLLRLGTETAVFPNMVLDYTALIILRFETDDRAFQAAISLFPP